MRDVLLIGSGPAALLLAVACADAGLSVGVLGADDRPWPANYGAWTDELASVGLEAFVGASWRDARVITGEGESFLLGRSYARVARRRLRQHLLDRLHQHGATVRWVRAASVEHDLTGSDVLDETGQSWRARVVVDASGHQPVFVHQPRAATAFQAAFGLIGRLAEGELDADVATFMDWRPADADALHDGPPSFLYAMALPGNRVLLEETSLIHAPAVPFPLLRSRLQRRMARTGFRVADIEQTELCLIPMDTPMPHVDRVLPFGAAASFVHPATGYQLVRAAAAARDVAAALAQHLGVGGDPQAAVRAAWRAAWPADQRAARELHAYGARVLSELDQADTAAFFSAFFRVPHAWRNGYLAARSPLGGTLSTMSAVFARVPGRLRRRLLQGGLGLPGRMVHATLGGVPGGGGRG